MSSGKDVLKLSNELTKDKTLTGEFTDSKSSTFRLAESTSSEMKVELLLLRSWYFVLLPSTVHLC